MFLFCFYFRIKERVISDRLHATTWRLGPVTSSSLFHTLMLSALLYPAGPYYVVYHLESMYSCTLRSFAIHQDHPWFTEVVTSRHQSWHILPFCFASLPFEATAMSARDNAIIAPLCSFGCDGLMHRGKQIGLLQHIFLVTPVERPCVSPGQTQHRMRPRLSVGILMSID